MGKLFAKEPISISIIPLSTEVSTWNTLSPTRFHDAPTFHPQTSQPHNRCRRRERLAFACTTCIKGQSSFKRERLFLKPSAGKSKTFFSIPSYIFLINLWFSCVWQMSVDIGRLPAANKLWAFSLPWCYLYLSVLFFSFAASPPSLKASEKNC